MARRASTIETYRLPDQGLVVLDGGDALLASPSLKPAPGDLNKAETIMRGMGLMGLDAMAVGVAEVAVGLDRLSKAARENSLTLLCANLVTPRRGLCGPRRLVETGGVKVGVFAVTEPEATDKPAAAILKQARVRLTDSVAAAREQVKALGAEGAEVVVMLAHTGMPRATEIARAVPGIHLAVVARTGMQLSTPRKEGGTYLVEPGRRGMSVGHVELRLGPGWGAGASLADDSPRHELYDEIQTDVAWLRERYKDLTVATLPDAQKDPRYLRLKALAQRLAGQKPPAARHTLISSLIELDRKVPDHPAVAGLVAADRASWQVPAPGIVRAHPVKLPAPVMRVR